MNPIPGLGAAVGVVGSQDHIVHVAQWAFRRQWFGFKNIQRSPSDQPLYDHYWGSGFLPSRYQGVKLRNSKDPVLYLRDPAGLPRNVRRGMLDGISELNHKWLLTDDNDISNEKEDRGKMDMLEIASYHVRALQERSSKKSKMMALVNEIL